MPESGRSPGEGIGYPLQYSWASLVAQMVRNSPTMWETWVQSLGGNKDGKLSAHWHREIRRLLVFSPYDQGRRMKRLSGEPRAMHKLLILSDWSRNL